MNLNKICSVKDKNILFLQGPMGSFFAKLEKMFLERGANTFRIGLNAGDYLFALKHAYTPYRDTLEAWPDFITGYLQEKKIDMIFLFGDCRLYQSVAIYAAKNLGVEVMVFEEGYIRPNYITMERYGVNDYSHLPRDPEFYRALELKERPSALSVESSGFLLSYSAVLYYTYANIFSWRYPYYQHHRSFSAYKELKLAARNLYRKYLYAYQERNECEKVINEYSKNYFFIPLQTHNDFQILQHSIYRSIEVFIEDVVSSFAAHAADEHMLIFKHHPVDRGRKDYSEFIYAVAREYGVEARIKVYHDVHLPTLLKNALGTITINSTVGLSSLFHMTPTLTMGNAVYGVKGLTAGAEELDGFWKERAPVDIALFERFEQYLIENTQINGSFYGRLFLNEEHYR